MKLLKSAKFKVAIVLVVIIILISSIVGYKVDQNNKVKLAASNKIKVAQANELAYKFNLKDTISLMISGGIQSETMCNTIYTVWHSAIYNGGVSIDGKYAVNFDAALSYQHDSFSSNGDLSKLTANKDAISTAIAKLASPKAKYKDQYNEVMDIYAIYSQFEGMAESPSGSLTSYNANFDKVDTDLSTKLKDYQARYPS